jgi:hypothetical protein
MPHSAAKSKPARKNRDEETPPSSAAAVPPQGGSPSSGSASGTIANPPADSAGSAAGTVAPPAEAAPPAASEPAPPPASEVIESEKAPASEKASDAASQRTRLGSWILGAVGLAGAILVFFLVGGRRREERLSIIDHASLDRTSAAETPVGRKTTRPGQLEPHPHRF